MLYMKLRLNICKKNKISISKELVMTYIIHPKPDYIFNKAKHFSQNPQVKLLDKNGKIKKSSKKNTKKLKKSKNQKKDKSFWKSKTYKPNAYLNVSHNKKIVKIEKEASKNFESQLKLKKLQLKILVDSIPSIKFDYATLNDMPKTSTIQSCIKLIDSESAQILEEFGFINVNEKDGLATYLKSLWILEKDCEDLMKSMIESYNYNSNISVLDDYIMMLLRRLYITDFITYNSKTCDACKRVLTKIKFYIVKLVDIRNKILQKNIANNK